MRAAGNTFRQRKFAYRAVGHPSGIEDHAVGGVGVHVGGQGDQVTVVLAGGAHPRRHGGLAAVDTVTECESFLPSGEQVVFDQAVEQEPPRFPGRGVGVAVIAGRVAGVDGAELGDGIRQLLFFDGAGDQVEAPAMQPALVRRYLNLTR